MSAKPEVVCPVCGASVAMRISRNGFWERSVLGRLGIYPWKCGACGVTFRLRKRGVRVRSGEGVTRKSEG